MAYCREFTCGCIVHDLAGTIRKCSGLTSRSMKGKIVKLGDESQHSRAIEKKPVNTWEVANILP